MRRVYPAYARQIAAYIQRGQPPLAVGVLFSKFWRDFREVPRIGIRPDEWELGRYELGWLQRQHVVLLLGEDDEVHANKGRAFGELLYELMLAGPRAIWVAEAWGRWIEKTGEPVRIAAIAEDTGVPAALLHLASAAYERTFRAASARRLDVMLHFAEKGEVAPPDGTHLIEQRFGDPLWAPDHARAA